MACDCALYCRPEGTRVQFGYPTLPDPGSVVCDAPPVYRPHHPEFSVFYQVFGNHFDNYVRAYEERFEPNSGPLRRVVLESVEEFLSCGRLQGSSSTPWIGSMPSPPTSPIAANMAHATTASTQTAAACRHDYPRMKPPSSRRFPDPAMKTPTSPSHVGRPGLGCFGRFSKSTPCCVPAAAK